MANEADSHPILRVFVFDSARLRSHVFFRYLSTHPDLAPISHPFLPAAEFGPQTLVRQLQHSEIRQREIEQESVTNDTFDGCRDAFLDAVDQADKQGKIVLANEHWFKVF